MTFYNVEQIAFSLGITWVVEEISGTKDANGYIVQKMHYVEFRESCPIRGKTYFEAWKVENGVCTYENKNDDPSDDNADDHWECKIENPINPVRYIERYSDVYWVSKDHEYYGQIDKWKSAADCPRGKSSEEYVFEAGALRAVWSADLSKLRPVFSRSIRLDIS